jgi:CelD/BcsL family acetyltransferase involved in cellulose biosynthesis
LWAAIEAMLQADPRFRHDAIVLEKLPGKVGVQANPFVGDGVTLFPSGAYLTHLTGDFDSFYAARRSSSRRKTDRWKRRRLGHQGEVVFSTASGSDRLGETLETLFAMKARSLAAMGVADMFAPPGHADFYRAVAAAPGTVAHVSRLDVGPVLAAANFGLVHRGRYYHVVASYTDGELARFGPGTIHLIELLAYAIAKGCSIFDFTVGDEPYKREWADEEIALYDLRRAVTPLGVLVSLPTRVAARIKRTIKQTPLLWHIAQVVRARLGAGGEKPAASVPQDDGEDGSNREAGSS